MSVIRSIRLLCDRCSRESDEVRWLSKTKKPKTIDDLRNSPGAKGWRFVNAAGSEKGGSRRYHFCPDSICQAAAEDVPQRISPLLAAQKAYRRAKARLEKLGGKA